MPRLHLGRCQAIRLVLEQGHALPTHGPTRAHERGAWLCLWRDIASRATLRREMCLRGAWGILCGRSSLTVFT